jgi:hypothetical protein
MGGFAQENSKKWKSRRRNPHVGQQQKWERQHITETPMKGRKGGGDKGKENSKREHRGKKHNQKEVEVGHQRGRWDKNGQKGKEQPQNESSRGGRKTGWTKRILPRPGPYI